MTRYLSKAGQRVGLALAILLVVLSLMQRAGATTGPPPTKAATATPTPTATPPPPTPTATPSPRPTATPTSTPTPTTTPTGPAPYNDWARARFGPPWEVDCTDEAIENGYIQGSWARDFCVPGLITRESYWHTHPPDFYGLMSSYAAGVMEAQLAHRGIKESSYKDGIAIMSCAYIGHTAWLRRPGFGWDGPIVIVDCSQKNHMYYHYVGMGLVVEVGYKTVERWGAKVLQRVDVHIGPGPPGGFAGVYLPEWWVVNKLEWEGAPPRPTLTPPVDENMLP